MDVSDGDRLIVRAGMVFLSTDTGLRLAVPDGLRNEFVVLAHGDAHRGASATARLLATLAYWPDMRTQIEEAVRACAQCQRINAERRQPVANLGDSEADAPTGRLRVYEVDTFHLGPQLGGRLACVVLERFSGWRAALLLNDHSAEEFLAAFHTLVVRPFGYPRLVVCDAGKELMGEYTSELERAGVIIQRGLAGHHRAASRVERAHRDINNRLAHMLINSQHEQVSDQQAQYWIDIACATANATPAPPARHSPHELLFGQQRLLSWSALADDETEGTLMRGGAVEAAEHIRVHRAALAAEDEERARARELSRRASENAYGSKRKPSTVFVPGELVLVRAPEKLRDGVDKNLRRLEFIGVFKVMQHDQRLQRVAVKLLMPAPLYHTSDERLPGPIEVDFQFEVHAEDIRRFSEGRSLDSRQLVPPLHIASGFGRQGTWNSPFLLSDADEADVSRSIVLSLQRLLTREVTQRASVQLQRAVDQLREHHKAIREELAVVRRRADDPFCRAIDAARADSASEQRAAPENDVVDEQEASAASSSATTSATSAQPQAPQRFDAELPRPLARPKPVQERRLPPLTRIFIVDEPGKMVTGLVQRDENGRRCQQGRRVTRRFEDLSEFDKQQVNRFLSRAGLARKKRSS